MAEGFIITERYCSADAQFSIKEVDVGLAADLGSDSPQLTGPEDLAALLAAQLTAAERLSERRDLVNGYDGMDSCSGSLHRVAMACGNMSAQLAAKLAARM